MSSSRPRPGAFSGSSEGSATPNGRAFRSQPFWTGWRQVRCREVVIEGHDKGEVLEEPKSPGEIHFARSLPIEKGRRDVLLAYQMNGRDLSPSHGFPVRAIVPGWYGMASVKWLKRIVLVDRPFAGYFQTMDYSYFERRHGIASLVPVTENEVKSQIARPARYEVCQRAGITGPWGGMGRGSGGLEG